jgi:LuxR family maltose regulon positive regulatory protein
VLHRHRGRPLVLLVAPAGYGKSTLAATYARESGGAVAWLTVDEADRDSRRLFSRLADSLEAGFEQHGSVPELRRGLAEGAQGVGLARVLLNDLAQAPAGFIIVLDDFHLVDDSDEAVFAIDALIRDLPEAGQIVITARQAPGLSMTRYVVAGAVFPLGTEDLRFSDDEARELRGKIRVSNPRAERDTPDDEERARRDADEDARDQQAEGWVAGILLGGAPRQLGAGGGTLLGGYVEREVLTRLTPTEQTWLESLACFDLITPKAAERLFGKGPWQARLIGLTERCPFLEARQDGTYRLHTLVRDTVLNRLRRSPDDRWVDAWTVVRELAEAAGDARAVVRACEELGDPDGALPLIRKAVREATQAGRWAAALVTLQLIPETARRAQPDLSLIEARALSITGRPKQALDAAEAALNHGGRSGNESVQLAALIELSTLTFPTDLAVAWNWLSAADHIARHARDLPDGRLLEGRALGIRGILCHLGGDVAEARNAFENAAHLLERLGPSRDLAIIQQNFGSFCNRTGDFPTAQKALESASQHWRVMGDRNGVAATQATLGELLLRLGNIEAAGSALADAVYAAQAVGALRQETNATVALGLWHRASGRLDDAIAKFDEGIKLAEQIVERETLAQALSLRAEVAIFQDDLDRGRLMLARAQGEAQIVGSRAVLAVVDRALGRLHLADGATDPAITYFEKALNGAGDAWGADDRAETLYWLGTAHLQVNQAQKALACLDKALELAMAAPLPAMLAGPAAEDPRLLEVGREHGRHAAFLGDVKRLAETRRAWTGATVHSGPVIVARNDLPRVEVQLFGSFELHVDGHMVPRASRKDRTRELAAVLILHPKGLPDSDIAEMMFPDRSERARHNLQMAAYALRKQLGSQAAVKFGAKTYQLSPQLELIADVHEFNAALARARGAIGEPLIQALGRACELYRGELIPDAAWEWLEPVRSEYRARYVAAAIQLADELAPIDSARSDGYAQAVLAVAPETDIAYERLILNARHRRDQDAVKRSIKQYLQAAEQFGFHVNKSLLDDQGHRGAR